MTDPIRPAVEVAQRFMREYHLDLSDTTDLAKDFEADRAAIRADERAKIVAWLRSGAGQNTDNLPRSTKLLFLRGLHKYADAIARGEHTGGGDY